MAGSSHWLGVGLGVGVFDWVSGWGWAVGCRVRWLGGLCNGLGVGWMDVWLGPVLRVGMLVRCWVGCWVLCWVVGLGSFLFSVFSV